MVLLKILVFTNDSLMLKLVTPVNVVTELLTEELTPNCKVLLVTVTSEGTATVPENTTLSGWPANGLHTGVV